MSGVLHDTQAAIDFLQKYRPGGPWVLTAIALAKKTETRTFREETVEGMRQWIEERQGVDNLYYMANPARRPLTSKADKSEVLSMDWLWVDVDPRAGEDLQAEQQRALKVLQEYTPAPTVIVYSGGGYQALWKLAEPVRLEGETHAEEMEAYNQQLQIIFSADHCHNIDRLLRLPGTINVPDEKKVRKGRRPALACVVSFTDAVYDLKQFTPAVRIQAKGGLSIGGHGVKVSGNVQRLGSVDDLPEAVPPRVKMLIVQGHDPDDPTKYQSRSEVLFHVCCALVRAGCDDDTIYSVITDPDFAISSSVLDKPRSEKYATRQIEKAREHAIDPMLLQLNEKHAVIGDDGGKCRIISIVYDHALKRERISRQSFDDFRNRYRHIKVQVGTDGNGQPKYMPSGAWWIDNPARRQYETIVFAPGREVDGAFNLWSGFACEALPGNKHLSFLEHTKANVCGGSEELFNYVINWMARAVQKPDEPGQVAIVLRGKQGTGKGTLAKTFGSLWGRHFLQVSDSKHLVGSFNAHLRDCVVLFGDEAFYAGDKKHEAVLKGLITEETLAIEAKGVDVVNSPNYVHVIMASNSDWVVPAGEDERRFLVLDVAKERMQDGEYFGKMKADLESGGRENLLYFLLGRDLTDFDVRRVPKTEGLRDQKQFTFSPEQTWWYEKLCYGQILGTQDRWITDILKDDLQEDYLNFMKNHGYFQRRSPAIMLGKFLKKALDGAWLKTSREWVEREFTDEAGYRGVKKLYAWKYIFPSLDDARAAFDAAFGGPFDWPHMNELAQESIPLDIPTEATRNDDEIPF